MNVLCRLCCWLCHTDPFAQHVLHRTCAHTTRGSVCTACPVQQGVHCHLSVKSASTFEPASSNTVIMLLCKTATVRHGLLKAAAACCGNVVGVSQFPIKVERICVSMTIQLTCIIFLDTHLSIDQVMSESPVIPPVLANVFESL